MRQKITLEVILLAFINEALDLAPFHVTELWSHDFETGIVEYGRRQFSVLHTTSTYARAWRKLKEQASQHGFRISAIESHSKETLWKIERLPTTVNTPSDIHPIVEASYPSQSSTN